jgi:hypothetical protein
VKCHWLNGLMECFEAVNFQSPDHHQRPCSHWEHGPYELSASLWSMSKEGRLESAFTAYCMGIKSIRSAVIKWEKERKGGREGREREREKDRENHHTNCKGRTRSTTRTGEISEVWSFCFNSFLDFPKDIF